MAFVFTIIANATALRRKCAHHVEAGFPGLCELVPEKCAPAALKVVLALTTERRDMWPTGDPVMLSPSGMILAAALTGATKVLSAPMRAKTMAEVRMNIFAYGV